MGTNWIPAGCCLRCGLGGKEVLATERVPGNGKGELPLCATHAAWEKEARGAEVGDVLSDGSVLIVKNERMWIAEKRHGKDTDDTGKE